MPDEPAVFCRAAGRADGQNSTGLSGRRYTALGWGRRSCSTSLSLPVLTSRATTCRDASQMGKSGEMRLQLFRQIGLFPGKTAILVRSAAEMPIGRRAGVDGLVKFEMFPDPAR